MFLGKGFIVMEMWSCVIVYLVDERLFVFFVGDFFFVIGICFLGKFGFWRVVKK